MTATRIVILGHAADRTGPPMYLLQLLQALDRPDLRFTLVLLRGGELLGEFQEIAEVRVVGEPRSGGPSSDTLPAEEEARVSARRAQLADLGDAALVVINTAWSIHALPWLPRRPPQVVSVVHELRAGVTDLLDPLSLAALLASDRFVVGCHAVEQMLVEDLLVEPGRVDRIPYGVKIGPEARAPSDRTFVDADPSSFLVLAAGVPDRRKGPDLFVHLASVAARRRPDIPWAFRWIGADEEDPRLRDVRSDRDRLAATDLVRFVPPTPRLRSELTQGAVFVLPSREDAFPLAAVEGALAGLPLLAFCSGGVGELVEPGAGALVAYPDLTAAADQLAWWHDHPDQRAAAGATARDRAQRNHDVATYAPAFDVAVLPPVPVAGSSGAQGGDVP